MQTLLTMSSFDGTVMNKLNVYILSKAQQRHDVENQHLAKTAFIV